MKLKIFFLALTLVLTAALCFAEGGQEEAPAAGAEAQGEMYGGTLTVLHQRSMGDPPSPAQGDCQVQAIDGWLAGIQERLLLGNIEEYGGMGNGEFLFEFSDYIPMKYITGHLIESWEVTPERAILNVRPGIYWSADHVDWMESRELTAEDIAFDINFFRTASWGSRFDGVLDEDSVYAEDKYTVVCDFVNFNNQFLYYVGWEDRAVYTPPELEDNNPQLWENQVGTGPFVIDSYTIGSSMTFTKNPNYWNSTTIDGEEYQMPFVDRLVFPIIPDAGTMMSAVRTGKVDLHMTPQLGQWDNYDAIGEGLQKHVFSTGSAHGAGFNCNIEPFDDVMVRQAMSLGTNREEIAKVVRSSELPIRAHPQSPANPTAFVPDSELPEGVAELWDYNPEMAKEKLAAAGYPDGFQTKLYVRSIALDQDVCAVLKEQWKEIGVDAEIVVMEPSAHASVMYAVEYDGIVYAGTIDAANPIAVLTSEGKTGAYYNFAGWSNARYDKIVTELEAETDVATQNKLIKDASKIMLEEMPYLALAPTASRVYWWDWVENYSGEFSLSDGAIHEILPYMWINQGVKDDLGF